MIDPDSQNKLIVAFFIDSVQYIFHFKYKFNK